MTMTGTLRASRRQQGIATSEQQVRTLVAFALDGLPPMRRSDGLYCVEVRADEMMRPLGRSIRYSIMVALGLLRARSAGYEIEAELDGLIDRLLMCSHDPSVTPGDLGLLLWLNQRACGDRAIDLLTTLERRLPPAGGLAAQQGMELGWIAIGAAKAVEAGIDSLSARLLGSARAELRSRVTASGLLRHYTNGWRRRFPNFATEIYGTLALATLGHQGDEEALRLAQGVAEAILRLQRADGGWPWIFDADRGVVAEPYEVYVVHQDAMAPMGLFELYEATRDERYRAAAVRGLEWIYGANDLGVSMFDPGRPLLYRSIRRKRPWDRMMLGVNTATAGAGRPIASRWAGPLELNRTDRPYHLGWVLEAWCGRERYVSRPHTDR